jgi:Bacterial alpha-L-rhamnosidase 6 hairpin glycosidase domain/Bacterial alpha-L-rhamnosidase C-terminal domain
VLASGAHAGGSFTSSDPLLNRIWAVSVQTARDMVVPGPLVKDAEGRPCAIALPVVIVDGAVRDRCPYIGDISVTEKTLLVSTPSATPAIRAAILWFARAQHPDGAIPATPLDNGRHVLFDYNAYWVAALYTYVSYTGDLVLARQVWPELTKLMNAWYPAQTGSQGLLVNRLGPSDYAYIHRRGTTVAYFNAGYGRALRQAAALATWLGKESQAESWRSRWASLRTAFDHTFWDAKTGAFLDTPTGPQVHPEDGNAFAILAGFATPAQATSALAYLGSALRQDYGNTIVDHDDWSYPGWGGLSNLRVYPFIGYFELLARYTAGQDDSALELIRREWGYMVQHEAKPGMWEDIGPHGGGPTNSGGSEDHGWSSGPAPVLTNDVLGVQPASPGFRSFLAEPHLSGLEWAKGDVPTPKGNLHFECTLSPTSMSVTIRTPVPGTIKLPLTGWAVLLDGQPQKPEPDTTTVTVGAGSHWLLIDR